MEQYAELKHKLRKLKKLEGLIRFGTAGGKNAEWVWDAFFKVKYPLHRLAAMSRDEYHQVITEYFYHVYYRLYKENPAAAVNNAPLFDPEILARMGLPPDAGGEDVRKAFRALAKVYHPDAGGDGGMFIALKEQYDALMNTYN